MNEEKWRKIKNHDDYEVSSKGRVKCKGKLIETNYINNPKGKIKVLYLKSSHIPVYRLVAEAFLSNPNKYKFVYCIDGDKNNTNVNNLVWRRTPMPSRKSFPSDAEFDLNNLEDTNVQDLFLPVFLKKKLKENKIKNIKDLKNSYDNLELHNICRISQLHFERILDYFSKVYNIDYNKKQEWRLFHILMAKSFKIIQRKDIRYAINFTSIHELFDLYALNAVDEVIHYGFGLIMVKYKKDKMTLLKKELDKYRYEKCYIKRNKRERKTIFSLNDFNPNSERFRKESIIQVVKGYKITVHVQGLYDKSTDVLFNKYELNKIINKSEVRMKEKNNIRHHLIRKEM